MNLTKDMMTTAQAAELLGVHTSQIRRWIATSVLVAYKWHPRLNMVLRRDILKIKARREKR